VTSNLVSGRYRIGVKYYSSGSMGTSRGVVVVCRNDVNYLCVPTIIPFSLDQQDNNVQYITEINV